MGIKHSGREVGREGEIEGGGREKRRKDYVETAVKLVGLLTVVLHVKFVFEFINGVLT